MISSQMPSRIPSTKYTEIMQVLMFFAQLCDFSKGDASVIREASVDYTNMSHTGRQQHPAGSGNGRFRPFATLS